jgi:Family of unknown function (DUF6365)
MKLLVLAPSRRSRGDAIIAADLARALGRPTPSKSRYQVAFAAAPEVLSHLHDLGMPTLPLTGATPADNLAILDQIVAGFRPDLLVAADAFELEHTTSWSGLAMGTLRERYDGPVASLDRLGWQAVGYKADLYGGGELTFPPLLDDCDVLIRPCPPHRPEPGPAGVAVAPLRLSGLRDGGRASESARADHAVGHEAETARPPLGGRPPRTPGQPTVFLSNSAWEYRNRTRSLAVAELIDALPRLVHSHLAALGRPLRVVHVGPRQWRFPLADQIDYRHFSKLPYQMFHEKLAAADLFVTTNVLSVTLAQAVLAGVPALVLDNHQTFGPAELPGWTGATAPLLHTAYPFRVAPLGWHDFLEPLLAGNPYAGCFATAGILDRQGVLAALTGLLDDEPRRSRLAEHQQAYRDALAGLAPVGEALATAVSR